MVVFIVILCIFSSSSELKCDNTDVMNLAIDAFKESSLHYRSLSPNQVSRVILENPTEVSHDDSINKYFCKGTIVIKPAQGSGDYRCNVEYTAQQNDDTVYVETSNCNDKYINSKLNKLFDEVQYQVEYSYDE